MNNPQIKQSATISFYRPHTPPEIVDAILGYLQDNPVTLRACSLVCRTWLELCRPRLFHTVVCRPAVPSFSLQSLGDFLAMEPEMTRHIRSLRVYGANPDPMRYVEVPVEAISAVLVKLPRLTHIEFELVLFSVQARNVFPLIPEEHRCTIDALTLRRCLVTDDQSFYQLFAATRRVKTLVLDHVRCMESPARYPTLPDNYLQVDAIHMNALLSRAIEPLKGFFRYCRAHTPLHLSLMMTSHLEDDTTLGTFLTACKDDLTSVSANVVGAVCALEWMVEGLPAGFEPGVPPRVDLSGCTSLTELVLYFTTTSVMSGRSAIQVYTRMFSANTLLILRAPVSLSRIELRFQRYGPHVQHSIDELRAIDEARPSHPPWRRLDDYIIKRFPTLQEVVCVLSDDRGFLGQAQCIQPSGPGQPAVHSKQEEFDGYVRLLREAFPQLHRRGLLHFEMAHI